MRKDPMEATRTMCAHAHGDVRHVGARRRQTSSGPRRHYFPKPEPDMSLQFYGHPFSSYCQKVLTALYENATPFEWRPLGPDEPRNGEEFAGLWPIRRKP